MPSILFVSTIRLWVDLAQTTRGNLEPGETKMRTRQPLTQEQKIQNELTNVAKFNAKFDVESENMPEGFSTGYIGNAKQVNNSIVWDDRSWMVFRAHEGRMGTKEDCIGGYSTEERYKLLPIIKAIKFTLDA